MKANGTAVYQRQHKGGLTMLQLSAIDLLASGKTDKETAELLNRSRTCVSKRRLYSPLFQATLNRRRPDVWGAGLDRLPSLIPKALDALADELENREVVSVSKVGHFGELDALADELENRESPHQMKTAVEILRLAQLPADALAIGPTEAEEIVRQIVVRRREQAHGGMLDDLRDEGKGLPPFERHLEETWRELEERAMEPDEAASVPSGPCGGQGR